MKLSESYYLFASCKTAKELEGKLNTAIVTQMFDMEHLSTADVNDFLSQFDWLTASEKVHVALSAFRYFILVKSEPNFSNDELETIRFCVSKMLEVNKLQHGEMCAQILTGNYDRTEEFENVLIKIPKQ